MKCAGHVSTPVRRAQSRLWGRIPDTHAILCGGGNPKAFGELAGDQLRLIKPPVALPIGVQRHGQNQVERLLRELADAQG